MENFKEVETTEKEKNVSVERLLERFFLLNIIEKSVKSVTYKNTNEKNETIKTKEILLEKNEYTGEKEQGFRGSLISSYFMLPKGTLEKLFQYKDIMIEESLNLETVLKESNENSVGNPINFKKHNDFEIAFAEKDSLILNMCKEIVPQPILLGYLDGFTEEYFDLEILVETLKEQLNVTLLKNPEGGYIFNYMNIEKGQSIQYIKFIFDMEQKELEKIKKTYYNISRTQDITDLRNQYLSNIVIKSNVLGVNENSDCYIKALF